MSCRTELDPLPTRPPEVAEVALARGVAAHEEDVVDVVGAKHAGAPARPRARRIAADAELDRVRDDLAQRRIAGERVRQLARLRRVRAAELDRARRAAAFGVAGVERQRRGRVPVDAGGRIETREDVVAVERRRIGRAAQRVAVADVRAVVAGCEGEVQVARRRDTVSGEDARRSRPGVQLDVRLRRADVGACQEVGDRLHAAIGEQERRLRRLREARPARVERRADDGAMRRRSQLQRAARLRRDAGLVLPAPAAPQHCVALRVDVASLQRLRDAEQVRKRGRRRIDDRRRGDSGSGERRAVGCRQGVELLVERVAVEVAVDGAGVDPAQV